VFIDIFCLCKKVHSCWLVLCACKGKKKVKILCPVSLYFLPNNNNESDSSYSNVSGKFCGVWLVVDSWSGKMKLWIKAYCDHFLFFVSWDVKLFSSIYLQYAQVFSSLMGWEKVRMGGWGWVGATWAVQSEALKIWCLHWFQKQEKNNQIRTKSKTRIS
jgi:hypothetical protein